MRESLFPIANVAKVGIDKFGHGQRCVGRCCVAQQIQRCPGSLWCIAPAEVSAPGTDSAPTEFLSACSIASSENDVFGTAV